MKKSSFLAVHEGNRWRKIGKIVQKGIPFHFKTSTRDETIYLEHIDGDNYRVVGGDETLLIPGLYKYF